MKFLLLGSLALLALAFVSTSVSGELVTVNVSANNTVVSVKLDDIVHVELSGNPSTGAKWRNDFLVGDSVIQQGKPTYKPNGPHHGTGGVFTFPYQASEVGSSTVRLEYTRSWEPNPTNWFQVTFYVAKSL